MAYFVYILRNINGEFYTGMTQDLTKRLRQHNANLVKTTSNRGKWQIVIFERVLYRTTARLREKYWKSGGGRRRRQAVLRAIEDYPYEFKVKK